MGDIESLRHDIDEIDKQLTELFEKRMNIAAEVAKYKEKHNLPILVKERENEVIAKNLSRLKNKNIEKETKEFFEYLMTISRKYQAAKISPMSNPPESSSVKVPMSNLYGLIGERLGHSFSPAIHSIIMQKLDIKGCYHLFEIEKGSLRQAFDGLKHLNIKGVNVTIPYKIEVMEYLDEVSREAKEIGAVNTICFKENKAYGFNTDYYGFGMMLDKMNLSLQHKKAVVLGAGGAANSVVQYLKDNGIKEIALVSRNKASAKCKFKDLDIYSYEEADLLRSHDMIINCTPCGMHPNIDVCPVPSDMIGKFSYAIDLIYNPIETLFLKYAREKGLTAANGLYMLAGQAVKSQELWNGIEIPISMVDEIYGQSVELRDQNSELRG